MTVIGSDMTHRELRTLKIVQILVYGSTRHFTLVIADENPCCEPPSFMARFIYLPRAYDVLCWCVGCKRSAAQEEKKRENSCREPIRFCDVLWTLTLLSDCVFHVAFILFHTEKCDFFSISFLFRQPRNLHLSITNVRVFPGKFLGKIRVRPRVRVSHYYTLLAVRLRI
jgi:hypothetical protein